MVGGTIQIREHGTNMGNVGTYSANSVGEVRVNHNGVVEYRVDGTSVYNSTRTVTYPLNVDVSFYSPGGEFDNIRWLGESTAAPTRSPTESPSNSPTPSPSNSPTQPIGVGETIDFGSHVGLTSSTAGQLYKSGTSSSWDAGAVSNYAFTANDPNGIAGVSITAKQNDKYAMLGLNSGSTSDHYNDIDFALYQ